MDYSTENIMKRISIDLDRTVALMNFFKAYLGTMTENKFEHTMRSQTVHLFEVCPNIQDDSIELDFYERNGKSFARSVHEGDRRSEAVASTFNTLFAEERFHKVYMLWTKIFQEEP